MSPVVAVTSPELSVVLNQPIGQDGSGDAYIRVPSSIMRGEKITKWAHFLSC